MALSIQQEIKQRVGKAAADFVKDGMLVGLGSGSTAACFIESLSQRCHEGLKIQTVATSQRSAKLAQSQGIPVLDINTVKELDLTIDGADEIDSQMRMIKGGGGALLREKIIATMSREMIAIVDSSKLVKKLGAFGLPVEIIPFGHLAIEYKLFLLGFKGKWRLKDDGTLYVTDNGHYILDIHYDHLTDSPERDHAMIRSVTGVVETGFFIGIAKKVIVGYPDASIKTYDDLKQLQGCC